MTPLSAIEIFTLFELILAYVSRLVYIAFVEHCLYLQVPVGNFLVIIDRTANLHWWGSYGRGWLLLLEETEQGVLGLAGNCYEADNDKGAYLC